MAGRFVGLMRSKDRRYPALEASAVIFGVLVALRVDRWREDAAREETADERIMAQQHTWAREAIPQPAGLCGEGRMGSSR